MTTLYMVRSNPVEGREIEFNRWYEEVHVPEVLQIQGFESAQRFKLTSAQVQEQNHQYLAIYAINSEDVEGTLNNLRKMRSFNMSDSIDMQSVQISIFSALGEEKSA